MIRIPGQRWWTDDLSSSRSGRGSRRYWRPAPEGLEARELLSFAAPVGYNVGTQADDFVPNATPINVVSADFNGDGKLDLAVAHKADNSVYMLLGNGNGTFQSAVHYGVGEGIEGREFVGDFNNDGKLDLFLPGAANQAIVLLGNGNGTFRPRIDSSSFSVAGTYPRGWGVGDFNGDGKLDVASTLPSISADSGGYTVLLGNGDGSFQAGLVGPMVLHYSRWMAVADFDQDGKLDLAVADGQGFSDQTGTVEVTILLGNGDGTFKLGPRYASPQLQHADDPHATANPEDVIATDVNADGKLDLIVSDYDNTINVFLGNGDGTFQSAHGYEPGHYPRSVVAADVNGDGKADLVVTNVGINSGGAEFGAEGIEPGSVSVMLGDGDGTFQDAIQYQPFAFPEWTAVGDFNGDGAPDLAVTRVLDGHTVDVMLDQPADPNLPPTVVTDAGAPANPMTGTTTSLSVLGADDGGEANLTYSWTALPTAPAPVTFGASGTNAAKSTTATFSRAGSYDLQVTITDSSGASAVSLVTVTVNQKLTSITIAPGSATVAPGGTQQFTAVALDQFGAVLAMQPAFNWTVGGGGTISGTGLFAAGAALGGPFTVTATSGSTSSAALVSVANVSTLTVYSLAGDGRVANLSNNGTGQALWDMAHDAATGLVDDTTANRTNWVGVLQGTGVVVLRGYLAFDTSALPANAVILDATLGVFVTGKADSVDDGLDFISVVQGLQASSTSLTASDYPRAGDRIDNPTEGSDRLDITNITTNAYAQWTLNTSGLSWIVPGGITQLAVREGHDIRDVWPGFTSSGQTNSIGASMSEQPGTSQDPFLRVTYTIPAADQPPPAAIALDSGGGAAGSFAPDADFAGGTTYSTTDPIDTTAVTDPAPQAVYQAERYGNFTYTIPGLVPGASYTVRLHFAEIYWSSPGQRLFDVAINGAPVLTNFDIVATAGGPDRAVVEQFTATADPQGRITIAYTTVRDNAKSSGIEVIPITTPVVALDSGGPSAGPFAADADVTGGFTYSTTAAIDTSGVTDPAPQAVYQAERYGNFTYTIPGLVPGASYTVRLHFAEIYWSSPGQRLFDVAINGAPVLTSFDIVAAAGGPARAIVEQFTATADAAGRLVIQYTSVRDNAKGSGIEIIPS